MQISCVQKEIFSTAFLEFFLQDNFKISRGPFERKRTNNKDIPWFTVPSAGHHFKL